MKLTKQAVLTVWALTLSTTVIWGQPSAVLHEGPRYVEAADLTYGQAIAKARAILHSRMDDFPSLSVAVGVDGRIVWTEGFGWADIEQRVPVRPSSKFRVGSVAKPMTAALLALIYERGGIDLDAPVQRYVPSFPAKKHPVTTRQLAGHIAGIRHYQGDEFLSSRYYETVLEGLEIFENDPLLFEPGTQYSYSTYGWNFRKNYSKVRSANVETSLTKIRFPEMVGCRPRLAIGNLVALDWLECGAAVSHDDELGVFFEREDRLTRADDGCVFRLPWVARSTGAHRY